MPTCPQQKVFRMQREQAKHCLDVCQLQYIQVATPVICVEFTVDGIVWIKSRVNSQGIFSRVRSDFIKTFSTSLAVVLAPCLKHGTIV